MINGAGDVSEGIDYMKRAEAANAGAPLRTAIPRRADGLEIELEDVSFSYEGAERPVLSCVNMHIHTGEIVAIVGPSGVGKSTLARILQGRNRPQTGILKLNGMIQGEGDFADGINPVAMVAQEPTMFHRTIWDNIVLGELRPGGRGTGSKSGRHPQFHLWVEGRLSDCGRRARNDPVGRPSPANRHRPGVPAECPMSRPRRADLGGRSAD